MRQEEKEVHGVKGFRGDVEGKIEEGKKGEKGGCKNTKQNAALGCVGVFSERCDNGHIKEQHSWEEDLLLCCGLAVSFEVGESGEILLLYPPLSSCVIRPPRKRLSGQEEDESWLEIWNQKEASKSRPEGSGLGVLSGGVHLYMSSGAWFTPKGKFGSPQLIECAIGRKSERPEKGRGADIPSQGLTSHNDH
ncbi:unnamed protein product [Pleuronectes platessa]|uniref:Uncharacterized protein n=1 Tax=Pleuronectes platessa TaxID=8262 RepID=A0A9N7YBK8_PLEPL|nr:unnamed protein product [Pleuronectes platessa]